MKTILLSLAALGLATSLAVAQATPDYATVDADADASITWGELSAIWIGITEEQFTTADLDSSGGLAAEEYATLAATPVQ